MSNLLQRGKKEKENQSNFKSSEDKQWLLNAAAIKAARSCIICVQQELGIRLTLAHPDFLNLLSEYCELTDSSTLHESYATLIKFVGLERLNTRRTESQKPMVKKQARSISNKVVLKSGNVSSLNNEEVKTQKKLVDEFVTYKGKKYKRWNDEGKEFKGLYRGAPRYS